MEPSAQAEPTSDRDARELALLKVTRKAAQPFGLSHLQIAFAMFYLQCGHPEKAALAAGYAKSTALKDGDRILRHPKVAAFIRMQLEEQFKAERMEVPEVLARLARIGRGDPRKLFNADGTYKPIHELDEATAACIRGWEDQLKFDQDGAPPEMTRKIKFADPVPALRTIAQVNQLLQAESHTTNVFINMAERLDAAQKRLKASKVKALDAKVVSEQ